MTWSLLEMARSLRTCPWGVLARAPLGLPRIEELPADLEGLKGPWGPGSVEAILALPASRDTGEDGAGATWLPLHGRVAWTTDPAALAHDDALSCWMRVRLTDAFHAARVALLSADQRAADVAVGIVAAFRARHPLGSAPAWDSAMEAALRSVRLLHVAALLREARARHGWSGPPLSDVALSLAEHEALLRARCDWRLHFTGNHHLVALAGTFLLALHIPSSPASPPGPSRERRARHAFALFWREFCREVELDGVHFESSTGYHLLVAETAAHVALLGEARGFELSSAARERLASCAAATAALARPDGTLAAIGDCDDGAFLDLSPSQEPPASLDARPALALLSLATAHAGAAAKALASAQPRDLGRVREALTWLAGSNGMARLEALAGATRDALRPAAFPDSGFAVLAMAGDPETHVSVSCTASGRAGTGGHGHDDSGAYELWLGEPVIVDRGTGAYARDPHLRRLLRSAASHAVVQVDAREMNGPAAGIFRREARAKPMMTGFTAAHGGAVAIGHHGYCSAPGAVSVLRSLSLSREGELVVEDELAGSGEHDVVLRVPLAPGLSARITDERGEPGATSVEILSGARLVATCRAWANAAEGVATQAFPRAQDVLHARRQLDLVHAVTVEIAWRLRLPARVQHRVRPGSP